MCLIKNVTNFAFLMSIIRSTFFKCFYVKLQMFIKGKYSFSVCKFSGRYLCRYLFFEGKYSFSVWKFIFKKIFIKQTCVFNLVRLKYNWIFYFQAPIIFTGRKNIFHAKILNLISFFENIIVTKIIMSSWLKKFQEIS